MHQLGVKGKWAQTKKQDMGMLIDIFLQATSKVVHKDTVTEVMLARQRRERIEKKSSIEKAVHDLLGQLLNVKN